MSFPQVTIRSYQNDLPWQIIDNSELAHLDGFTVKITFNP
jgi:hypothetical protein